MQLGIFTGQSAAENPGRMQAVQAKQDSLWNAITTLCSMPPIELPLYSRAVLPAR
jgi:hypothetical protein